MKPFLLFLLSFLMISCEVKSQENHSIHYASPEAKISQKIAELKAFLKESDYNSGKAFLIDFSISSYKFSFFVVDLKSGKIVQKGLVAHGDGSEDGKVNGNLKFSNIDGSHCSSLGKYVVEEKYKGKFGMSYRLTGLDETNSNARNRAIVLHRLSCVPDVEQSEEICLSFGCPMVSDNFFKILEQHIDKSDKKLIIYAYN
ncbi:murein L,D-transpeptidase catalytic domain family protein [Epilithonimonas ginsengisoli]|uniref:Murein L,D-transpeptidase catalytic domain family protein n=1 Tax=Epilithonimonas ginsengisoli TaxID=1245592 RepID=A0ABU4JJD9_9FLAO|nr:MULTISPECIES: murein L,D-transpeptidase catalytic domain family protein [Chryseobacterium group]MDW8549714.1 murein L,D-transpeptidase catalytic domain family protein [Epilithonimonas ginsengisoli]